MSTRKVQIKGTQVTKVFQRGLKGKDCYQFTHVRKKTVLIFRVNRSNKKPVLEK